jgi:hypothetical protein
MSFELSSFLPCCILPPKPEPPTVQLNVEQRWVYLKIKNFPVELEGIALRFPSFEAAFEKFDLEKPQLQGSLLSLFQGIAVAILRARQHKLRLGPRPFCCPSHSS